MHRRLGWERRKNISILLYSSFNIALHWKKAFIHSKRREFATLPLHTFTLVHDATQTVQIQSWPPLNLWRRACNISQTVYECLRLLNKLNGHCENWWTHLAVRCRLEVIKRHDNSAFSPLSYKILHVCGSLHCTVQLLSPYPTTSHLVLRDCHLHLSWCMSYSDVF